MSRFIHLDGAVLEKFLQDKGFWRRVVKNEVVYIKSHKNNEALKVAVYTSLTEGQSSASSKASLRALATTRAYGTDAIRVSVYYNDGVKSFGIAKLPHIKRSGSTEAVLLRLGLRIREAYLRALKWQEEKGKKE